MAIIRHPRSAISFSTHPGWAHNAGTNYGIIKSNTRSSFRAGDIRDEGLGLCVPSSDICIKRSQISLAGIR
jgi:hypothetical protein